MTNFNTQIKEKFEGAISQSVEKMLKQNLGITKKIDVERTQHTYDLEQGHSRIQKKLIPSRSSKR